MTTLARVTTLLTGMPGLPGTNTYTANPATDDPAVLTTLIHDFYDSFHTNVASALTMTTFGQHLLFDSTTGVATGTQDGGDDQAVTGGNSGEFLPLPIQLLVQWRTGVFFGGRELRGRTFLAGFVEGLNDNGVPNLDLVAAVSTAANDLAGHLVIWSPTHLEWASVSRATVWFKWAELRSRRD
jgi:hypothetical protein